MISKEEALKILSHATKSLLTEDNLKLQNFITSQPNIPTEDEIVKELNEMNIGKWKYISNINKGYQEFFVDYKDGEEKCYQIMINKGDIIITEFIPLKLVKKIVKFFASKER